MTQDRFHFGLVVVIGMWMLALPALAEPQVTEITETRLISDVPNSARMELKRARLTGWSNYSSYIYNRVSEAYQDGLTEVDPSDLWTNYTCVALADVLADLGQRERAKIDIVMRTHMVSGNVFIIKDGAMRSDPHSFSSDEMYALVTLMRERFLDAVQTDASIQAELETSFDGCSSSLRAESRAIE